MKICVHDGVFHADDVCAVALAIIENPHIESSLQITRSRVLKDFEDADLVLDVGMQYDGNKFFDHHQDDIKELKYDNGIQKAACGLYLDAMKSINDATKQYLLNNALYAVQMFDNGQRAFCQGTKIINPKDLPNPFTWVSVYNCDWKTGVYCNEQDNNFRAAIIIAVSILKKLIRNAELKEESDKHIQHQLSIRQDEEIVCLSHYCPWLKFILDYNNHNNIKVKVVVYKDSRGQYLCEVVPKDKNFFESWRSIPEDVTQLPGFIFKHKAAFLAGFDNYDSAYQCAKMTVS